MNQKNQIHHFGGNEKGKECRGNRESLSKCEVRIARAIFTVAFRLRRHTTNNKDISNKTKDNTNNRIEIGATGSEK